MQQEIEVKFLDVQHDDIRQKLVELKAQQILPKQLMLRAILDYPDQRLEKTDPSGWGWVRVRDEGNKVTCTYKHITKDEKRTTHEIEFEVSEFQKTIQFFEAIGLKVFSIQETRREVWQLGTTQIMLDEWPWIPPYLEVEGDSETAVHDVSDILGMDWQKAIHGSSDAAYRIHYPKMTETDGVTDIESLTFSGEMPNYLRERQ